MILGLIIILAVYILSCLGAYKFIQKAYYHEDEKWNKVIPETKDITVTFFPFTNTFISIMYLFGTWRKKENKAVDFFKPKNK